MDYPETHPTSGKRFRYIDQENGIIEYESGARYDLKNKHLVRGVPENYITSENHHKTIEARFEKRRTAALQAIANMGEGDINRGIVHLSDALAETVVKGGKNQVTAYNALLKAAGLFADAAERVSVTDEKGNSFTGMIEQAAQVFNMKKDPDS